MNIAFIVLCEFPYGSATSMRARNICRLLKLAGHNVHVISDSASDKSGEKSEEFSYEAVYKKCSSFLERQLVTPKSIKALKNYCKKNKIDAVLTNARYDRFNSVARFCKKNGMKMIVENCEWYDPSSFKLGERDPRYKKNQKMIIKDFKKADAFISISRLLDEHNRSFGRKSVRIPTILDVQNTEFETVTNNEKITIVYTGSPGRNKEFLRPLIEVLAKNEELRKRVEFDIYGPSYGAVCMNIGDEEILKKAGESVKVHGRVPQAEIQKVLTNADYLIFLRPQRRSSDAGFPTKLGESFAVGTPVIANDTGDLSLYIKSGENGFLLDGSECEELEKVLEVICSMDREDYQKIRQNARNTAEKSFDFRSYKEEIKEIF